MPKTGRYLKPQANIVDQDILFAEQHGWPQDAVRQPSRFEMFLHLGFAAEIRKIRIPVGIGYANVHDARDACPFGGIEQPLGIATHPGQTVGRRGTEILSRISCSAARALVISRVICSWPPASWSMLGRITAIALSCCRSEEGAAARRARSYGEESAQRVRPAVPTS